MHSLQNNPQPCAFGAGSWESGLIKKSNDYGAAMQEFYDSATAGETWTETEFKEIASCTFNQGDLKYAVARAHVEAKGSFCKPRNYSGSVKNVSLEIKVWDDYDFHHRDDLPTFVRWGNNMAYENQKAGVIVPFRWTATFNESRGGFR